MNLVHMILNSFEEAKFEISGKFTGNWIALSVVVAILVAGVTSVLSFL